MEQEKRIIGQEIHRLAHSISKHVAGYVKKEGIDEITLMHGWIMKYLYKNRSNDIFQKDIEKSFSIGRSTVTSILQILEKKGYVKREYVEHDARLKKVLLTEKGIKNTESIESMFGKLDEILEENVTEQERDVFFRVCDKVRENLESQNDDKKEGGIECCEHY